MNYILDMHTHTLASGHAYSTIREMAQAAKDKGLSLLGISEHTSGMPNGAHDFYFHNLKIVDRNAYPVLLRLGAELNILDEAGTVDLPSDLLTQIDYGIASLHPPCIPFLSKDEITHAILKVMENPYVQIIGHLDDERFLVDYEEVVKQAKQTGTIFEVNNSSLSPTTYRQNAAKSYEILLDACARHEVPIILNSDAHVDTLVGCHIYSKPLIQRLKFPETLIINSSVERCLSIIENKKQI